MKEQDMDEVQTKGPENVALKDVNKLVGRFAVLFRNNKKVAAKIVEIDLVAGRIVYELLAGLDKGKMMTSKYDPAQSALIYDTENLMLALMDVE
jgi:nitrogen-specific signal transduction histidine kinase